MDSQLAKKMKLNEEPLVKANTKTDQIQFDGSSISVKDLKNKIRTKCCLYAADLDLKLEDSSGKVYDKDEDLIPKYANIIVRRVPKIATEGTKKKPNLYDENQRNTNRPQFQRSEAPNSVKSLNLANSNLSEEEKIKLMMEKSSEGTPEKAIKMKPYSIPPANYVCHKCGQSGHWVHDCVGIIDSAGNKVDLKSRKRPTGIPSDMLLKVDAGTPGAYLSRDGTYSVPIKDAEAYAMGKKDKRPFSIEENPPYVPPVKEKVREDLKCPLCNNLFNDAVIVTCCSTTYCSDCITDYAFSGKNNSQCPNCGKELTSFETNVLENRIVRNFVREYLQESKQEANTVEENERFVNNRRVLKPKPSSSQLEQQVLKQSGESGNIQAESVLDPSASDSKNLSSSTFILNAETISAMNTMNVISGSPNHNADNFPTHVNLGASSADQKAVAAGTSVPSSGIVDLKPGAAQLGQVVNGLVIPGAAGPVMPPSFLPNPLLAMSVANSLLQNQANWHLNASTVGSSMAHLFARNKILSPEEFQRRKDALLEKKSVPHHRPSPYNRFRRERSRSPYRSSRHSHSRSSRYRRSRTRSRSYESRHRRHYYERERRERDREHHAAEERTRKKSSTPVQQDKRRVVISRRSRSPHAEESAVPRLTNAITLTNAESEQPNIKSPNSEHDASRRPSSKSAASTNATTDSKSVVSSEVGAESYPPSVEPGEVLEMDQEDNGLAKKEKKPKKKKEKDVKKSKKSKKEKKSKRTSEERAFRKAQKEAKRQSRLLDA